jgi:fluoride exporter
MLKFVYIGIGGAMGAIARYLVSGWVQAVSGPTFPWGTLVVNATGSFVLGLLWGVFEEMNLSDSIRLFAFVGILGSFTTFSTFSFENFQLFRDSEYGFMAANIVASVIIGIAMVFAGVFIIRVLVASIR